MDGSLAVLGLGLLGLLILALLAPRFGADSRTPFGRRDWW